MNDFNGKLTVVSAAVGTVGAFIARAFGGWDSDIVTLIILMVIDYITGIVCAAVFKKSDKTVSGALSSDACFRGLFKKIITLLLVLIAHRLDLLIGADYIRNLVVIAFCTSELISICENAGLMGVPLPKILTKAIDILKNRSEEDNDDENRNKK